MEFHESCEGEKGETFVKLTVQAKQLIVSNRQLLREKVRELLSSGVLNLVVDLTKCSYVDMSATAVLINLTNEFQEMGGTLRLDVTRSYMSMLELSKRNFLLNVRKVREKAA